MPTEGGAIAPRRVLVAGWIAERLGRVTLRGLPPTHAAAVVAVWCTVLLVMASLLVPGALAETDLMSAFTAMGSLVWGWWVLISCSAVLSAVAVVLLGLRTRSAAGVVLTTATAVLIPVAPAFFLLRAVDDLTFLLPPLIGLVAGALAAVGASRSPGRMRDALVLAAALATVVAWIPLLVVGLVGPFHLAMMGAFGILGPAAAAITGLVAVSGVAAAAETANVTAHRIGGREPRGWLIGVCLAGAAAVIVLRYTVLRDVFGDAEANLWAVRDVASWSHAGIVAVLIAGFALRAAREPLEPRGQKGLITILTLSAGLGSVVALALITAIYVVATVYGSPTALGDPTDLVSTVVPLAGAVLVVGLVPWFLRRRYRGTTGRVGAVVTLAYLVPFQLGLFVPDDVPGYWASPSQVVAMLVLVTGVLFVIDLADPRELLERRTLVRLAVIPVITLHAGELLPALWSDALDRPAVVAAAVVALLLLAPARTGDARRDGRALLAASGLQLALLATYAFATLFDSDSGDLFTVIAVIWLAVPVSAVLCCRVRLPGAASPDASTTADGTAMPAWRTAAPAIRI